MYLHSLNRDVVSHSYFLKSPHGQNDVIISKITKYGTCFVRITYIVNVFQFYNYNFLLETTVIYQVLS